MLNKGIYFCITINIVILLTTNLNHFQVLPDEMPTQVYGLHPNAGIIRDIMNMSTLQNSLLKVLHTGTATSGGADDMISTITSEILESVSTF